MNPVTLRKSTRKLSVVKSKEYYAKMADAELIVACQQRDEAAFQQLLERYQRTVRGMLYRLAPDWQDTADLSQEVFIRIWWSIDQLRNPYAFKSWLKQIVTNLFYDELRK